MTPEAQRIAIAEACGWIRPTDGSTDYWWDGTRTYSVVFEDLPDYLSDLNAMHEAVEKVIEPKGQIVINNYLDTLCIVTNGESAEMDGSYVEVWNMSQATAAQRAEAFLRTIGKWDDTK